MLQMLSPDNFQDVLRIKNRFYVDNYEQTMSIERDRTKIEIEHDRIIVIRLSIAIESQSNDRFLGNVRLGSIGILRSIAFD